MVSEALTPRKGDLRIVWQIFSPPRISVSVLEVRTMQVKEVMTNDPACCAADTPLPQVARIMIENDCGEIPVIDNRSSKVPIGVVTDRDIVSRILPNAPTPVELTPPHCLTNPILP